MIDSSKPRWLAWEQTNYHKLAHARGVWLRPVAKALTWLGVRPWFITILGTGLHLLFVGSVRSYPRAATVALLCGVGFDALDGVLARYQQRADDRGKFIDMMADNVNFVLLVIGIISTGLLPALMGLVFIYTVAVATVLRVIMISRYLPTDWYFKTVAGLLPSAARLIPYGLWCVYLLFHNAYFSPVVIVLSAVMAVDSLRNFTRIMQQRKP